MIFNIEGKVNMDVGDNTDWIISGERGTEFNI